MCYRVLQFLPSWLSNHCTQVLEMYIELTDIRPCCNNNGPWSSYDLLTKILPLLILLKNFFLHNIHFLSYFH